jgi:5-hydroxyisourate hydrolase-like protein (transthyretin family)
MKLTIKQGDTRHAIRATLKSVNGEVIDLSAAAIRFVMVSRKNEILIDREANLESDGRVSYVFEEGETDIVGDYAIEFLVTYEDAREETFPHKGFIKLTIEQRNGGI